MKKFTLSLVFAVISLNAFGSNIEPKKWNNNGAHKVTAFKKGDTVMIKAGTKSAVYVKAGKIETICSAKYVKIDGYFISILDIEVITKYNTVK